jgi:TrbC/VIRB2 pilin
MSRTRRHILIVLTLAPVLAGPKLVVAALETAAGGGGNGSGGFSGFVSFLDNVATYLVYVGAAAGVLGLIAAGGMLIAGSPEGGKWLTRTVIGVGIVLLAKGIMA